MNPLSLSEIYANAISVGIKPLEAQILAKKSSSEIQNYLHNIKVGAYDTNGILQEKIKYGEKIRQDKNQKRRVALTYPHRSPGPPQNLALKALTSFLATAFTQAGGVVTLNQEGNPKNSAFHNFMEPIYISLRRTNVRDYIADHMSDRSKASHT